MTAMTINGFSDLLQEVDAGHPVIIFENLTFSWWPQWHYAVVYGYDLDQQLIYLHTGKEQNTTLYFARFEADWRLVLEIWIECEKSLFRKDVHATD